MKEYGAPIYSFPDQAVMGWVGVVVGLLMGGFGGFLSFLIVTEGYEELNGDVVAGFCLLAFLLLFGVFMFVSSLRDVLGKPTWHITASHALRVRGAKVLDAISFREEQKPYIVETQRNGATVGFSVQFSKARVLTPGVEVAQQIMQLWARHKGIM